MRFWAMALAECAFALSVFAPWGKVVAAPASTPAPAPLGIVAAENFYGGIARAIGGRDVNVRSILDNPDQDPHFFEASPSVGRAVQAARIVIYNGIGYDPWMAALLKASPAAHRKTIVVADLVRAKMGENPHLWYAPATGVALARVLAAELSALDPAHAAAYAARRENFLASMRPVEAAVAALRAKVAGAEVAATEPVVGRLLASLGLKVVDDDFQRAVMNGTEPSAASIATLIGDLKAHRVRLLLYNRQATDPIARRMREIAQASGVPVVAASETEPSGLDYPSWLLSTIEALQQALLPEGK